MQVGAVASCVERRRPAAVLFIYALLWLTACLFFYNSQFHCNCKNEKVCVCNTQHYIGVPLYLLDYSKSNCLSVHFEHKFKNYFRQKQQYLLGALPHAPHARELVLRGAK